MPLESEPIWLDTDDAIAVHDKQIIEFGGLPGIRDSGALESAVARAKTAFGYGQTDLMALASAYAFGIARNHPFSDGNKRTAFVMSYLFLELNGVRVLIDQKKSERTFLALASGELTEDELADWFRKNLSQA